MPYENAQEARWRKEEEAQARYENVELLSMGLTPGSVQEMTKTERTWAEIEADDAAFYDRYEANR